MFYSWSHIFAGLSKFTQVHYSPLDPSAVSSEPRPTPPPGLFPSVPVTIVLSALIVLTIASVNHKVKLSNSPKFHI